MLACRCGEQTLSIIRRGAKAARAASRARSGRRPALPVLASWAGRLLWLACEWSRAAGSKVKTRRRTRAPREPPCFAFQTVPDTRTASHKHPSAVQHLRTESWRAPSTARRSTEVLSNGDGRRSKRRRLRHSDSGK